MDYMQQVEHFKYMLGRFSMLFADMYAKRPHKAQLECVVVTTGSETSFGKI